MKLFGYIALLLALIVTQPVWAGHGVQLGSTIAVQVEGDVDLAGVQVLVNGQAHNLAHDGQFVSGNWPSGSYEIGLQLPDSLEMIGEPQTIELTDGSSASVTLAVAERGLSSQALSHVSNQSLRLLALVGFLLYIGWRTLRFDGFVAKNDAGKPSHSSQPYG